MRSLLNTLIDFIKNLGGIPMARQPEQPNRASQTPRPQQGQPQQQPKRAYDADEDYHSLPRFQPGFGTASAQTYWDQTPPENDKRGRR